MSIEENGAIKMLPDRLNRIPVVFKGMTIVELLFLGLIGIGFGLVLGIILFILFGKWILIFCCAFFGPLPTIFLAGNRIARIKRGKPDTWFPRWLEFTFAKYGFNKNKLLIDDEHFIVRRKQKVKRK